MSFRKAEENSAGGSSSGSYSYGSESGESEYGSESSIEDLERALMKLKRDNTQFQLKLTRISRKVLGPGTTEKMMATGLSGARSTGLLGSELNKTNADSMNKTSLSASAAKLPEEFRKALQSLRMEIYSKMNANVKNQKKQRGNTTGSFSQGSKKTNESVELKDQSEMQK